MSKWVVDIHGDIEGDYEIIKKYEEPKTGILDKIREEIKQAAFNDVNGSKYIFIKRVDQIIDKYKAESEEV